MTYYDVLGVSRESTYDEIKTAFHQLARSCHPDKTAVTTVFDGSTSTGTSSEGSTTATNSNTVHQFRQIQQAWEILRDETRRKLYNQELEQEILREKAKRGGLVPLQWSDLEEAQEEDTGDTIHVYDCRCGEELVLEDNIMKSQTGSDSLTTTALKAATDAITATTILMECPGCCFVYQLPKRTAPTTEECS